MIQDKKIIKKPNPNKKPFKKNVKKDFLLERFDIKITKKGNIINPSGSIKKGGYSSEVDKPKIKNFKKIN